MFKLAVLALLFFLLQHNSGSIIDCDESNLTKCVQIIGEYLDTRIKDANIVMLNKFTRDYIDMLRVLKTKCNQRQDCIDPIDKMVGVVRTELGTLYKEKNNKLMQLNAAEHINTEIKKDTLERISMQNKFYDIGKERNVDEKVLNSIRDFIEEVLWYMNETVIELKEKNIKLNVLEGYLDEIETAVKGTKEIREKLHDVIIVLVKMGETYDMLWCKEIQKVM